MLTALLLLLGLSGAGAGLYSVLKDPKKDSSAGDSPGEKLVSGGRTLPDGSPALPPGRSGGYSDPSRGREKSFGKSGTASDSNSASGSQNDSQTRSQSGSQSSSSTEGGRGKPGGRSPSRDEIQPETLPLGDFGSPKEDLPWSGEEGGSEEQGLGDWGGLGSPGITHTADDIISKNSKYSHHRRPLLNAEKLVDREKLEEALEIYQRTESRIPDADIKEKLQKNIDDLKKFRKSKEKLEDLYEGKGGSSDATEGLRDKLEDFQPGSPIPIRDLAEAIREISEALSESLSKSFYPMPSPYLGQTPPGADPGDPRNQKPQEMNIPPPGESGGFERKLPPNFFPQPIIYQIVSSPGEPFQAKYQPPQAPIQAPSPFSEGEPPTPTDTKGLGQAFENREGIEPEHRDLPEDTFFTREWDRFKDLPLTDRRSGKERRQKKDRRRDLGRKDRRSGEDRRKVDLFKEREEYLKRKAEEKKEFLEKMGSLPGRLSDSLEPFYPPPVEDLPSIGLPSPEEPKSEEKSLLLRPEPVELTEIGLPDGETLPMGSDGGMGDSSPSMDLGELPPSIDYRLGEDEPPKQSSPLPDPIEYKRDPEDPGIDETPEEDWVGDQDENRREVFLPDPIDETINKEKAEEIEAGDHFDPIEQEIPSLDLSGIDPPREDAQGISSEDFPADLPEKDELYDRKEPEEPQIPVSDDFQKHPTELPAIRLPDPEEMRREHGPDGPVLKPPVSGDTEDLVDQLEDRDAPDIEVVDGDLDEQLGEIEEPQEETEEQEPEKILHGVLELKPPEVDDAPFLTLTYDFSKIPHGFRLSKNYSIMEYSYYKYKPMLMKAQEFARRKMLKNALNYYRVIKSQNIPPEMRKMINRNIQDITEFMEKFLMAKGG